MTCVNFRCILSDKIESKYDLQLACQIVSAAELNSINGLQRSRVGSWGERGMLDRSAIEALLMPITYGRHLARLFDAERLFAGTGLKDAELRQSPRPVVLPKSIVRGNQ